MTDRLPKSVQDILPGYTAKAWPKIVPYVPEGGYLAGGTAIAVHLGHRISRATSTSSPVFRSTRRTCATD